MGSQMNLDPGGVTTEDLLALYNQQLTVMQTKLDALQTALTNVISAQAANSQTSCIKSVQRGVATITNSKQTTVAISTVNTSKCHVTLYPINVSMANWTVGFALTCSLSASALTIYLKGYISNSDVFSYFNKVGWEVLEFY